MTSDRFRDLLSRLSLTQAGAAKLLQSGERTVRRWASGDQDIPRAVQIALALMVKHRVTPKQAEKL